MTPTLYIGNKNYSSWSMRPWLALRWADVGFEERVIPLGGDTYGTGTNPAILAVSPSGRVPALAVGETVLWDSLAICEWANEQTGGALWPKDSTARALARSVASEMHSSFAPLRRDLSMNLRRRTPAQAWAEDTKRDIARLTNLWTELRTRYGARGPWLFGERSIADAFYAPVATRLRTYGIELTPPCKTYCTTIFLDAAFAEWERAALSETWMIPQTDALYP